jgi:ABC-2 type transport system permease protein
LSTLTGTTQLLKLMVRLDRIRLTVWILLLGLVPVAVASSFLALYDTEAARQGLAATVASSPGLVALLGPIHGTSVGALTSWRIGTIGAVLVALMAVFTVIRHTRLEEETGRRELVGSTVLGRHAPLLASSVLVAVSGVLIGVLLTLGLLSLGEDGRGAVAFGLGWTLVAVAFAAVGALAAQLTESSGGARGLAGGVVGILFALRMAGDGGEGMGIGWLSWLSPIGWVTKLEPFGDERWWVLSLFAGLTIVFGSVAFAISARRDVGAGVFPARGGPADASPSLSSARGLAWRLQKGPLVGWIVSVGLFATVWGGLGDTIGQLFDDSPQLAAIFEAFGGQGALTDMFFAAAMGIVALIVTAYAIDTALTLRAEEDGLRAEPVLATATSRLGWAGGHLLFAALGPVVIMAVAGAVAGFTYGLIVGAIPGQVASLVGTALLQVPAIWVGGGVAVALYGIVPRLATLSWGVLVAFLLLGQLGQILQLPQWSLNLSPFTHVPVPPEPVSAVPLVILTLIAAGLFGAGLIGLQRRDMQ